MPPALLIWSIARSVLTRISAPSTAVSGTLSSRTPILIGDPVAGPALLLVPAPPPPAAATPRAGAGTTTAPPPPPPAPPTRGPAAPTPTPPPHGGRPARPVPRCVIGEPPLSITPPSI